MKTDNTIQIRVTGEFKTKLLALATRRHTDMTALIVAALVSQYSELEGE